MKQCQLCEAKTRKQLKRYKKGKHDFMVCGDCYKWCKKKLIHG